MTDITSNLPRFDRYRTALKGTWKDEPLPAAGQVYDLGSHLIDQALVLFGRPESLTAFSQNVRGIGHPDVDDSVSAGIPMVELRRLTPAPSVLHLFVLPGQLRPPSPIDCGFACGDLVRSHPTGEIRREGDQGYFPQVRSGCSRGTAEGDYGPYVHSRVCIW